MKKLSKNQGLIQDQSRLIKEEEKESKVILEAVENLKESEWSQADMAKKLEEIRLRRQEQRRSSAKSRK